MPTTSTSTAAGTSGVELTPRPSPEPAAVKPKPRLVRSKSLSNLSADKWVEPGHVTSKSILKRSKSMPHINFGDKTTEEEKAAHKKFKALYKEIHEVRPLGLKKLKRTNSQGDFSKVITTVREMQTQTMSQADLKRIHQEMDADGVAVVANIDDFVEGKGPAFLKKAGNKAEDLAGKLITEIGPDEIYAKREVGKDFEVAEGTSLGVRLEAKVFKEDDVEIRDNPLRLRCTREMKKACRKLKRKKHIRWIRTGGVTELGGGKNFTVPLSSFASATFGFTASSILKYECMQPYLIGITQTARSLIKQNTVGMPTTASSAKKLRAGSEFKITGQGKLHGHAKVDATYGLSVAGVATLGVGAGISGSTDVNREYSVHVIALDGQNRVRVTVRDIDEEAMEISAKIQAGLIFNQGASDKLPFGQGALLQFAEKQGQHSVEDLATHYTSLTGYLKARAMHKDTEIWSYDLDLSKPGVAEAYNSLFKLNCAPAEKLAKLASSGVRQTKIDEKEIEGSTEAGASLFGLKLAMANATRNQKHGFVVKENGDTIRYRDKASKKHSSGILAGGSRDVTYQTLQFRESTAKEEVAETKGKWQNAYHFCLKEVDDHPTKDEVDAFFRYAESLGIESDGKVDRVLDEVTCCKSYLTKKDDTHTDVDIFYTQRGIENIGAAKYDDAMAAYLQTACELDPLFKQSPLFSSDPEKREDARQIVLDFIALDKSWIWIPFRKAQGKQALQEEYWIQTEKTDKDRELAYDARVFMEAQKFANSVSECADASNPRQISKFFINFGNRSGFDYQQATSALQKISTPEETLIHHLSIQGGGVHFASADEGEIKDPRHKVSDELTRIDDWGKKGDYRLDTEQKAQPKKRQIKKVVSA